MSITKDNIISSFRTRLEHYGYRKTSVEDIARELHISKKTIYVHFEGKEEMFRRVLEQRAAEERARIDAELASLPSCDEKITGLIAIVFRETRIWWQENRTSEYAERFEIVERAFLDAYTALIAEWVHSGVDRGEFHTAEPELAVVFIGGIILAGTRLVRDDPDAAPETAVIEAVRKLLA